MYIDATNTIKVKEDINLRIGKGIGAYRRAAWRALREERK